MRITAISQVRRPSHHTLLLTARLLQALRLCEDRPHVRPHHPRAAGRGCRGRQRDH